MDEQVKNFITKDKEVAAETQNTAPTNDTKKEKRKSISKEELINLVKSLGAAIVVYFICFKILDSSGVNYFLSRVVGYGLGLLVFSYIGSVLTTPSELVKPIVKVMTLILLFSLAIHYLPESNLDSMFESDKNNEAPAISVTSETGTVYAVGGAWFTDARIPAGTEVTIEVTFNSVQKADKVYTPGIYHETVNDAGQLMFCGVSDNPATIKVTY
jgi:hypothetical protein